MEASQSFNGRTAQVGLSGKGARWKDCLNYCEAKWHAERMVVRFIHGVAFDITELKGKENDLNEALNALSKSEKLQRNIFEFAPDTMVVEPRR